MNFDSFHEHEHWTVMMLMSSSLISRKCQNVKKILGHEDKPYCKGLLDLLLCNRECSKFILIFLVSMLFYRENLAGIYLIDIFKIFYTNKLIGM